MQPSLSMCDLKQRAAQAAQYCAFLLILNGTGCVSTPTPRAAAPLDVDGYTAAGWTLMKDGQSKEAVDLLKEALIHHPDAFQVHVTLGQVLLNQARVTNQSLEPALETYRHALTLGLETRERTLDTTWTHYQATDLRAAARMTTLLSSRTGSPPPDTVHRYLEVAGHDPIIERNLQESPPHSHP